MTATEIKVDDEAYARDQAKVKELMAEMVDIERAAATSSHSGVAPPQGGTTGNGITNVQASDVMETDSGTPGINRDPSQEPHFRDCPCGRWRPHTQAQCQCGNTFYFRRAMDQPPDEQFVQSLPV